MPSSVILGCKSGIGKKSDNLAESKKVGAKPILTEKGEVVYEVEGDEGKNKKVPAQDAMREIYKYMHGKRLRFRTL